MKESDRQDIIQKLAHEYGLEGRPSYEKSKFDPVTGTLFIGSRVYKYTDLENAKLFFDDSMKRAREKKDAAAGFYEIGVLAIDKLLEQSVGSGGRLVIKDDEG